METTFIYFLEDPRGNFKGYVGKADDPYIRFKGHLIPVNLRYNTKKNNWLNSLRRQGLKPILVILDEVPEDEWQFWEPYWIAQFTAWGFDLTNSSEGGRGRKRGIYKVSEETKKKLSIASTDRKQSIETKQKRSRSLKGRPKSQGFREKISKANSKKVHQIDFVTKEVVKTWSSITEAARFFKVATSGISQCCCGFQKTTRGFAWQHAKD